MSYSNATYALTIAARMLECDFDDLPGDIVDAIVQAQERIERVKPRGELGSTQAIAAIILACEKGRKCGH